MKVLGMQHFNIQNFSLAVKAPFNEVSPFVGEHLVSEGKTWYVLLLSRLVEDPRFLKAAVA